MKKNIAFAIGLILLLVISCRKEYINIDIEIPDFNFPKTLVFEDSLSSYEIFEGTPSDLSPSEGFELLELSSVLFTDYSHKQRLVKIPEGTQMTKSNDEKIDFPNGTILTKTFFYYNDERDTTLGKRVIETRLEIKENDIWNIATYIWNQNQTDAILKVDGLDTPITWIDENGISRSTVYHIPSENECMTCHQSNSTMTPLGPTLRNLNRNVHRNGSTLNQLTHLQNVGVLNNFSANQIGQMVNYDDPNTSLEERGRAYLAMNCAHCHNPGSWERSADREFDFRYDTPFNEAGILFEEEKIKRVLQDGEMPLIGTTMLDDEGVDLIIQYLNSL
ncbi:MAG: hypothetical protein GYB31_20165 [Bacteroidetes bacterium]|nr:hypothetical protein [Bacteroidota bacterium]